MRGISEYNSHQKAYRAVSWESLRVGGQVLNATVMKAIEECEVFCCDLTYRNHNVLFELGFAIGKRRSLIILLNPTVAGAKETYSSSRILKNIGYETFATGKDILRALQNRKGMAQVPLDSYINVALRESNLFDLLYLGSRIENQAALDLRDYIRAMNARTVLNDSSEVEYQTLAWYVAGIVKSKNVLIHLLGKDKVETEPYNAEYSLFAGLACGLGKEVMLLAPRPFKAPIDYSDILIEYDDAGDCVRKTSTWLERRLRVAAEAAIQPDGGIAADRETGLLQLGIGYETAEEEESHLLKYFIEIETYGRAMERSSSIITGRKGAGKSALFIKLKDHLGREHARSLNLILKPESDELLENVELTSVYDNPKSKRALLSAVWRLVFFAGVFSEIYRLISSRGLATINEGTTEAEIMDLYQAHRDVVSLGHFSAMAKLYQGWADAGGDRADALDHVYRSLMGPISDVVRRYFHEHKFSEINLLADNLDKTWDAGSDLAIQADTVLALLEFAGRIPQELGVDTIKTHAILILRTDIYEYIAKRAREPDKLEARRVEVDWSHFANRLRELLEARFRFILGISDDSDVENVWKEYFSLPGRRHPFEMIKEAVVARPRDVIYFVSKLFESALYAGHSQVEESDFQYAREAYSNFLHHNMIAETQAEFPEIVSILSEIQTRYAGGWLPYNELTSMLGRLGYDADRTLRFIDFLFGKNYMVAQVNARQRLVDSSAELLSLLAQRRLFWFRKHRARVWLNPAVPRLRSGQH